MHTYLVYTLVLAYINLYHPILAFSFHSRPSDCQDIDAARPRKKAKVAPAGTGKRAAEARLCVALLPVLRVQ